MNARIIKTALLCLFGLQALYSQRPSDPWIFRGVMKEKPRMIFMDLHANLAVAYEAPNCGLYSVWRGGMMDGNAIYTLQRGGNLGATIWPMSSILHHHDEELSQISEVPLDLFTDPRSSGGRPKMSVPNNPPAKVWEIRNGNTVVEDSIDYRGYSLSGNNPETATLRYRFTLPGGEYVHITEVPEYAAQGSDPGMTRVFTVSGLPAGHTVRLRLTGTTVIKEAGGSVQETWTATGDGSVSQSGGAYYFASGNGTTTLTGAWR